MQKQFISRNKGIKNYLNYTLNFTEALKNDKMELLYTNIPCSSISLDNLHYFADLMQKRAIRNTSKFPCYKISIFNSIFLTRKEWIELTEAFIRAANFQNCQRVSLISRSLSKVDLIINLIDDYGNKWKNGYNIPRILSILSEIEKKFGLEVDKSNNTNRHYNYRWVDMRTKCSCSGSFRATLSYVMGKQLARLISTNIPVRSVEVKDKTKEIIQTMILRSKGYNTSKNCYHISISPTDRDLKLGISDRQWIDISESFTKKIGLEKNPRVCVVHEDTGRPHLHLVFSLIDRNSRRTQLHHNYYKNQAALKEVEKEFGLEQTWENNYWLHTPFPEKKYDDRFNKYRSLLPNLGLDDFEVGKYRLQAKNNSNINIYNTSSTIPLISASFAEDNWLIEHNNSRQEELLVFQQLDREIQGYFPKKQSNQAPSNTPEIEL